MPAPTIDNIPLPQRRAAAWWIGLFGLPFMAFAFWLLLTGVWPALSDWARMSRWQPVQATLLNAQLTTRAGTRGDGNSREATATYRYTVGDTEYTGQRVGIVRGGDNVGSYQADLAHALMDVQRRGDPVPVWVNPANPADAVIDRQLHWGLLALHAGFALVFSCTGMGLLFLALRLYRAPTGPLPAGGKAVGGTPREATPGRPRRYGNVWLHPVPGGVRLHLPYGRDLGRHIGALAGGTAFIAVAIAVWSFMERSDAVAGIFAAVFGLVGVAFAAGSVFCITTSLHTDLDERGIRVRRRFLGLPLHSHQVPPGMVKRLELLHEQTTEHRGREIAWYRLRAQLKNGGTIALTDSLEGEDTARGLYRQVLDRSGYRG